MLILHNCYVTFLLGLHCVIITRLVSVICRIHTLAKVQNCARCGRNPLSPWTSTSTSSTSPTNPLDVQEGAKPHVQEIGPYAFLYVCVSEQIQSPSWIILLLVGLLEIQISIPNNINKWSLTYIIKYNW